MQRLNFHFVLFGILFLAEAVYAQEFSSLLIPKELKQDANLVVLESEIVFEVISIKKSIKRVKEALTVLNKEGDKMAQLLIPYDQHSQIKSASARMYNGFGKLTKKYSKKDFDDYSSISSFSIYEDNRVLTAKPVGVSYPYTIVYEYEVEYFTSMFFPWWVPMDDEKQAVQKSSYTAIIPNGYGFRYKMLNIPEGNMSEHSEEGTTIYKWFVKDLPAMKFEPMSKSYRDEIPMLYTAPNEFEMDGYKGNMKTWEGLAAWDYLINEGRDEISPETATQVSGLVKDVVDKKEKVRIIYEYLQNNTRYVSIQLGIGGFQAFDAKSTADNGYGDCKALTTYMKGMLKSQGIDSYYALVRAGSNAQPMMRDFPSSQFNHVFLCVPDVERDTVWLECTSQNAPFGYLGNFTGDRDILLVKENGGEVVRTPTYSLNENTQKRAARVTIDKNGDAKAEISTRFRGLQYENDNINHMVRQSREDQKKWLYKKIDIPSFEVLDFDFNETKSEVPYIDEELTLQLRKLGSASGKRLFLKPNLMNKWSHIPESVENRKTDFQIKTSFYDVDSIVYEFPTEYHIEHKPSEKSISSTFGEYSSQILSNEDNKVVFIRELKLKKGVYPSDLYQEFIDFTKKVTKADKQKIVLVNKT